MRKLCILCAFILTACGSPPRATPAATPALLTVALPPSLGTFREVLSECDQANADFSIDVIELPVEQLDAQVADLVIRLGGEPEADRTFPIGDETIALVVNSSNPIKAIPVEQLNKIMTGRLTSWAEVGGELQAIQVWVYPAGNDVRRVFDAATLPSERILPDALVAPNPQAMLEAIGDDPSAIGYVPQSWLAQGRNEDKVLSLSLDQKLVEKLHQPVNAFTRSMPEDEIKQLIACLQSTRR
jgi:DNA-binding transcriptional LysR family regulator